MRFGMGGNEEEVRISGWQPVEAELTQVLQLLRESQQSDTATQQLVHQRLQHLNAQSYFNHYLAFVLTSMPNEDEATRSLAGLILKNNVRSRWEEMPSDTRELVRVHSLQALADRSALIRATGGILITTVVSKDSLQSWPHLLSTLSLMLDNEDSSMLDGALSCLQKLCEDHADALAAADLAKPIIQKLLFFFKHSQAKIKSLAISCVNAFALVRSECLLDNVDELLERLFALALEQDAEVKKQLCRALTLLLDSYLEKLAPQLHNIVQLMLIRTQDSDEQVALEACEFWLALAEQPAVAKAALQDHLQLLLPTLTRCMRYSELDLLLLKPEDDADAPDRQEDIKPRFPRQRASTIDADDMDDDSPLSEWNVRKCAAASLDVLSNIFQDALLPILLPILRQTLFASDWLDKEAAILALGAIAEGCSMGMASHLSELVPYLVSCLQDSKALIRSITCWTLSRYCHWVITHPPQLYLQPLLQELLRCILDRSKRVQEAACSAFATLEEEACLELVPYLPPILSTLRQAFQSYQAKNLLILYDAVGTLADSVGQALNDPVYVEQLMPPLIEKWNQLRDDDRDLFPLLECLSSVATALQTGFLPFCEPVYQRCVSLIQQCLQSSEPDKDFMIVALDLLSGLAEGVGPLLTQFVQNSQLVGLLLQCAHDPLPEVRQSSFALLGDLSKACFEHLSPYVDQFLPLLINSFNPEHISVCNNAIWAVGELAVRMGPSMRQYAGALGGPLVSILNRQRTPKTLTENTAITLGRLGLHCADLVAPLLPQFVRAWCQSLRNVRDNSEKESAFRGLCHLLDANPAGIGQDLIFVLDAIASWSQPPDSLHQLFTQLLYAFRDRLGHAQWDQFSSQFPSPLKDRLNQLYGL